MERGIRGEKVKEFYDLLQEIMKKGVSRTRLILSIGYILLSENRKEHLFSRKKEDLYDFEKLEKEKENILQAIETIRKIVNQASIKGNTLSSQIGYSIIKNVPFDFLISDSEKSVIRNKLRNFSKRFSQIKVNRFRKKIQKMIYKRFLDQAKEWVISSADERKTTYQDLFKIFRQGVPERKFEYSLGAKRGLVGLYDLLKGSGYSQRRRAMEANS